MTETTPDPYVRPDGNGTAGGGGRPCATRFRGHAPPRLTTIFGNPGSPRSRS